MARVQSVVIGATSYFEYEEKEYTTKEKMDISILPESLKEFQKKTNCEFEIIEALFSLAFDDRDNTIEVNNYIIDENGERKANPNPYALYDKHYDEYGDFYKNNIPVLSITDCFGLGGWYYNKTIASCNEKLLNKYIKDAIDEFLEINEYYIEDIMKSEGFEEKPTTEDIQREVAKKHMVISDKNYRGNRYLREYLKKIAG